MRVCLSHSIPDLKYRTPGRHVLDWCSATHRFFYDTALAPEDCRSQARSSAWEQGRMFWISAQTRTNLLPFSFLSLIPVVRLLSLWLGTSIEKRFKMPSIGDNSTFASAASPWDCAYDRTCTSTHRLPYSLAFIGLCGVKLWFEWFRAALMMRGARDAMESLHRVQGGVRVQLLKLGQSIISPAVPVNWSLPLHV